MNRINTQSSDMYPPLVTAVGGLDPSGGAGLFADQRAILSTGCHFAGICATLTIQNGIRFVQSTPLPPADIENTLSLIHAHRPISTIKTGALGSAGAIEAVCRFASQHTDIPLIVDPVFKSTTGGNLLNKYGEEALKKILIHTATLITPNLQEAAALCGQSIRNVAEMEAAAKQILALGAANVLIKGGHLEGGDAVDVLALADGEIIRLVSTRLNTGEVRGTGCALASLIAGQIALGEPMVSAVERAKQALFAGMKNAWFPATGPGILQF
ncbi:MAG: hydroxymethylpyrimidine/phosphomethylpyrimidine kinase [Deltaproteobacteria bacterium]|nr:hydroxymethylpyrimidine/phosphomethylpyrimidine kinase [Deltaproteobacteria bacterium]